MKRVYFILSFTILFSLVCFAQGHETFDNLEITGNSYNDGTFQGQDGSTWEFAQSRGDNEITGQAIMLGKNRTPNSYLVSGPIANGMGSLIFSYKQAYSSNVNMEVYVNNDLVYTATTNGQQHEVITTEEIEINTAGTINITFSNPTSSAGQVTIDDIIWTAKQQAPTLSITSPLNGEVLPPLTTPTIIFNADHFSISSNANTADGDGYIQYNVDGNSYINHFSTDAIVLTDLEAGEHEITLQLVDNNEDILIPPVNHNVSFTSYQVTAVSSIGALRESELDTYYTLTEEVVLSFQQEFRGQKYIQDATGAILINDEAQVLTKEYNIKDGITGISGKLEELNDSKLFTPIADAAIASSTNNDIEIPILDINDYMANPKVYESQVIGFEHVHFLDADGSLMFATGQDYDVSDGNDITPMRTNFYDADYIGTIIPEGTQAGMAGIAAHYYNIGQFFIRDMEDLNGTTLSVTDFKKESASIFPNPATDRLYINVDSKAQVAVFSIIGRQVIQTQVANDKTAIPVQDLNSGVYMVQVTQNGNTVTKKLIIK